MAAQTYGVGVAASTPNLGNVASGASGDTVFRITPSTGAVTRLSGQGGRVSSSSAMSTVTVSCGNQNACNTKQVNVKIGSGSTTNRGRQLANFTVASGTASITVAPTGTNPISFTISAIGKNSSKTFLVGADFAIAGDNSGLATGSATSAFYVWVDDAPNVPNGSASGSGSASANVYRALSLAETSALSFGRIVRPLSGSGSATVAASNGARTSSNVVWLTLPSPTRASYTATGEGGKALSISVQPSFTMTRAGGGSVTVDTNNNAATTPLLSSYPGTSGTYSFFVGGTLNVSSSTPGGAYSGVYTVTVAYN